MSIDCISTPLLSIILFLFFLLSPSRSFRLISTSKFTCFLLFDSHIISFTFFVASSLALSMFPCHTSDAEGNVCISTFNKQRRFVFTLFITHITILTSSNHSGIDYMLQSLRFILRHGIIRPSLYLYPDVSFSLHHGFPHSLSPCCPMHVRCYSYRQSKYGSCLKFATQRW